MIVLDYQDRRPIYEQIVERFEAMIMNGVLESDSQMPSVRKLAMELSINPNTIQRAYAELEKQGFIYPVKGRGNFVAPGPQVIEKKRQLYEAEFTKIVRQGLQMGMKKESLIQKIEEINQEGDA